MSFTLAITWRNEDFVSAITGSPKNPLILDHKEAYLAATWRSPRRAQEDDVTHDYARSTEFQHEVYHKEIEMAGLQDKPSPSLYLRRPVDVTRMQATLIRRLPTNTLLSPYMCPIPRTHSYELSPSLCPLCRVSDNAYLLLEWPLHE